MSFMGWSEEQWAAAAAITGATHKQAKGIAVHHLKEKFALPGGKEYRDPVGELAGREPDHSFVHAMGEALAGLWLEPHEKAYTDAVCSGTGAVMISLTENGISCESVQLDTEFPFTDLKQNQKDGKGP